MRGEYFNIKLIAAHLLSTRDMLLRAQKSGPKRSEKPPKLPPRDIYPHDIPKVCLSDNITNLQID